MNEAKYREAEQRLWSAVGLTVSERRLGTLLRSSVERRLRRRQIEPAAATFEK